MTWTEPITDLPGTALTEEQLLPDVALTEATTGRTWRSSQLRQRQAIVLCFMHAGCNACGDFVTRLEQHEDELRWADARPYVVVPRAEPWPFPVLIDDTGAGVDRLLGPDAELPVILVADRYTAAVAAYPAAAHAFPEPGEVVATVRHLALLCPECGV